MTSNYLYFPVKGLWFTQDGDAGPSLTMVGSPNFGSRSEKRDLESQLVILTENEELHYNSLFSIFTGSLRSKRSGSLNWDLTRVSSRSRTSVFMPAFFESIGGNKQYSCG